MSRIQNKLTDYDRAVRLLDISDRSNDDTLVNIFMDEPDYKPGRAKRRKLVEKLRYYRNPNNLEFYHQKYLFIQTKLEGIIRFQWKEPQRVLWYNHILPKIAAGKPIRIYLLKARQIGFSTLIEGIGSSLCNLFSDIRGTVVAHDKDTSGKIFRMCKLFYKKLPKDFRPARKLSNRHELELSNPKEEEELGLESTFSVGTAGNLHLGAGTTLRFVHLSELARYEEVNSEAEDALVSLFQTIPEKPGTFIFIETTAYGEGIGKRFWDNKDNGFDKIFISFVAEDEYRLDTPLDVSLLEYKSNSRYGDELIAREHVIHELKVWNPEMSQDEEWLKHESLCRLAWRRYYIDKKVMGKLELFQQEYPLTPEEAFRISGRSVFDTLNLLNMKKRADKLTPGKYTYIHNPTKRTSTNEFHRDASGHLKIFSPAQPDMNYFIGADISAGAVDGDYSVLQLFDERYKQVAVFRDTIDPDTLAYPLVTLAKLYNDARIIPEANSMGITTINKMIKDLEYTNIYIREKINKVTGGITNEWGFYTSSKTRPLLINLLRQLISSSTIRLFDPETIVEFLNFVFVLKNGSMRMEAAAGTYDDAVISTALAVIEIEQYIEEIKESSLEAPYGSIEWYAQQMDTSSKSSGNFGSVVGM